MLYQERKQNKSDRKTVAFVFTAYLDQLNKLSSLLL